MVIAQPKRCLIAGITGRCLAATVATIGGSDFVCVEMMRGYDMGLIAWIKQGFTNAKQAKVKEVEALSWCVPESIYCAWVWAVRYKDPVRLIVQSIRPGVDHVQAEAKINGEWTPLTVGWSEDAHRVMVRPWHRHFGIIPYRTVTLRQWIDEQIIFTEAEV